MTGEFILRLFIAALLGGLIGLEREYRAKEAGFRTHFLVALGSAMFMLLSQYGFEGILSSEQSVRLDPSRIAAQVVSGIGFIGAGTIIFQKHIVRGLTTAAGLWVTAAIGMTTGAGLFALSIMGTILVLLCLETMHIIMGSVGNRNVFLKLSAQSPKDVQDLLNRFKEWSVVVDSFKQEESTVDGERRYIVSMELNMRRRQFEDHLYDMLQTDETIQVLELV
jgi:putative Mg2+ transporter-C (MgtC) family protein